MDFDLEKTVEDEITSLIYEGRKIEAIKAVRKATFKGLKESKDYIERLSSELYEKYPERFAVEPSKSAGCGTAVFFLCVLGGLAVWLIG
jgi:ribosomal protein L7/L12